MQLVELVWTDAWADVDGFASEHGISITHKPMIIKTIGWLIQDDDVGVSIANECNTTTDGHTFRGRTFVPRKMVQSMTLYNLTKTRKSRKPKKELKEPAAIPERIEKVEGTHGPYEVV